MIKTPPIKRFEAIQPLSRDHHHGLLLCWKIRAGFTKQIPIKRIKKYTEWFYKNHIHPHFLIEEKYIFPVLGSNHELVQKALADHQRLRALFTSNEKIEFSLELIAESLKDHIRFEERILFNEIQKTATPSQLKTIEEHHNHQRFEENTEDEFWK